MTKYIAQPHRNDDFQAAHHTAVAEQVADLLIKAEMIVAAPHRIRISGQSMPADYVNAPDEEWNDIIFAIKVANETIEDARRLRVRKRLEAVL